MGELHLDSDKGSPFTGLMQVSIFDQDHRCHVLRSAIEGRTMFYAGVLDPHATIILIVGANVVKVLRMPVLKQQMTPGFCQATHEFAEPHQGGWCVPEWDA